MVEEHYIVYVVTMREGYRMNVRLAGGVILHGGLRRSTGLRWIVEMCYGMVAAKTGTEGRKRIRDIDIEYNVSLHSCTCSLCGLVHLRMCVCVCVCMCVWGCFGLMYSIWN